MSLQSEFEKQHFERPVEPYSESENPEQWCEVLAWTEKYVDWLKEKFESTNKAILTCANCNHSDRKRTSPLCKVCCRNYNDHYFTHQHS